MSATGRSDVRVENDFYATPTGVTRAIAPRLPRRGVVLDPCAGTGAIFDALGASREFRVGDFVGLELDADRGATARRKGYDVRGPVDALDPALVWPAASLICTNPPYTSAEAFIGRSLCHVGPVGTVAMLLRLNFLAGKKRAALWQVRKPDVFVLDRRPSFAVSVSCAREDTEIAGRVIPECGWRVMLEPKAPRPKRCPRCADAGLDAKVKVSTSDATEYAWFVWAPWATGAWHVLAWENAA